MRPTLPILIATCLFPHASAAAPVFVDRAADAGIDFEMLCGADPRLFIPESNGTGAAWLDYDGDGDQDLYLVNGNGLETVDGGKRVRYLRAATNRLYRNDGDWSFTDVTEAAGVGDTGWGNGAAVADVDNDGDPDLYVANLGADVFYLNRGDGTFVDATADAGLGHPGWSTGGAFGDVDRDGDLDLFVPCYVQFDPDHPPAGGEPMIYQGVAVGYGPEGENPGINVGDANVFYLNDGTGRFVESTEEHGLAREKPLCSYAALFVDADGDGWEDLLVTNDVQPNSFFRNRGDGFFEEIAEERGFARGDDGKFQAGMGLAVGDPDRDGDPDFFVTNFDFEPNNLYVNDGAGSFEELSGTAGIAGPTTQALGWGCAFLDAELDGDLDVFVANGHVIRQCEEIGMSPWLMPNVLFLQEGEEYGTPTFRPAVPAADDALTREASSRGVAVADPDDDGDLDLVVLDLDGRPQLLENRTERAGDWIRFRLVGTASPRDSYGARVEVRTGDTVRTSWLIPNQGIYSSHDPAVHFGLGDVERVDRARIRWTSGITLELVDLDVNREWVVREPQAEAIN